MHFFERTFSGFRYHRRYYIVMMLLSVAFCLISIMLMTSEMIDQSAQGAFLQRLNSFGDQNKEAILLSTQVGQAHIKMVQSAQSLLNRVMILNGICWLIGTAWLWHHRRSETDALYLVGKSSMSIGLQYAFEAFFSFWISFMISVFLIILFNDQLIQFLTNANRSVFGHLLQEGYQSVDMNRAFRQLFARHLTGFTRETLFYYGGRTDDITQPTGFLTTLGSGMAVIFITNLGLVTPLSMIRKRRVMPR
ncbi:MULTISPECIES: hypothetical protein [Lacticaseibacillus]|uniref:ABC transporter permease n=3 Tax=Lacticaseibacillus TaxID=2759736 RepID=A0AAN1C7G3_LACCA|nr:MULTISPECIES: hypothetical protein [Lacticaseibacillus]OFR94808.1 hypothetical protein HMPREF2861_10645 [Lactobacillus sp. HMSC068F07]ARY91205.1 hypothetical protein BGL52_05375 [Lacticaseibacillus casei]KAB1968438.1 hypothetical protein F9B82_14000 [Lacticaseibacillus casei]KLI76216.1 hypothetical protein AAW28_03320 [Lacticaseibacillus casei]MDE3316960.1 hypothetical protein [Lacticaseibacillus zeae]